MQIVPTDIDSLICAVLRGETPSWPRANDALGTAQFHSRSDFHGVNAMLHRQLSRSDWPLPVTQVLRDKAVQLAMWELRHQQMLSRVLESLDAIGVQPILIKGTGLGYSLYSDPALRTRGDTDMLIPLESRETAARVLESLGYERSQGVTGEFVSYQANYAQQVDGASHTIDLHWKISNSEVLSPLFTYGELRQDAQPLPALCTQAMAPSPEQSLLIACMHRLIHTENPYFVAGTAHLTADRLVWIFDIHMLAQSLTDTQWQNFVSLANQKGLRSVCLQGMRKARDLLGTILPEIVVTSLAQHGPEESATTYLRAGKLRREWMDIRALDSPARKRFLRELLFPSSDYMHRKYPGHESAWMPWLYLRRAASGLAKRLPRARVPGP